MKLKKLEILGFKSFPEKSMIHFPPGISAVVGPNGCGKSNIVDALRWVMGEQSVKQLRGKAMEDVIFAGSNGKPPLNMAEVSLTLHNDNGSAPEELKDFTEIMVTRKLFRSGESAYYLNKQPCRLKDVHNLFLGSGMGAKSYAVIQQGNIGAITDAGPEERRVFIEEAAGITRYKQRKTEALRKVAATDQNLLRLADIISEIKRQMASLKRQARKAELYRSFQDRIRNLDARIAIVKFDESEGQIREAHQLLEALKDADLAHTSEMRKLDAAIEAVRLERTEKNREISEGKSRLFDNQRILDRSENDLQHLKIDTERLSREAANLNEALGNLESKNRQVSEEIGATEHDIRELRRKIEEEKAKVEEERTASQHLREQINAGGEQLEAQKRRLMELVAVEARYRNTYQNASNNRESLKRRLKKADEEEALVARNVGELEEKHRTLKCRYEEKKTEVDGLDEAIGKMRSELTQLNAALAGQVKTVQTVELEKRENRSALAALQKMEDGFEWYKDGVKAVMKHRESIEGGARPDGTSILGLVADIVEPHPSYENAVESVFGEALQFILVRSRATGIEAIDYLRKTAAGRGGFLPFNDLGETASIGREALEDGHWLMDHVDTAPEFEKVAAAFLDGVIVAPDMETATRIFDRHQGRYAVVTLDGDMLYRNGLMAGGSKDKLSGILVKKQEIKRLKASIASLEERLTTEKDKQTTLEAQVREDDRQLQQKIEYRNTTEREATETERELYRIGEELRHEKRHLEIIRLEQEQLMGEESDIEEALSEYNTALTEIQNEISDVQATAAELTKTIQSVSARLETYDQKVMELKLKITSLAAEKDNGEKTLRRLHEFLADGARQFENLQKEIRQKQARRAAVEGEIKKLEASISGMYEKLRDMQSDLDRAEADFTAIDEKLRNNDSLVSEIQGKREKNLQKLRLLEVELAERRSRRDNIAAGIQERYQTSLTEFRKKLEQEAAFANLTLDAMENELARCRRKISNIYDVNLGAIREYEQLKSRHDFLVEQQEDLVKAVEDLHKVIRKINRLTKERFMNTFVQINEKLQEVFPALFEGGTAELSLTQPDDPLETGVEFLVHPPGKKLTRMSLLSGGEKALSAIAFIFAIFLIRPASFCLLDEIDAPLDEANIYRFNNLLKIIGRQSQIVMITHNKRSMEFADILFGVTMQKKGVSQIVSVNLEKSGEAASQPA